VSHAGGASHALLRLLAVWRGLRQRHVSKLRMAADYLAAVTTILVHNLSSTPGITTQRLVQDISYKLLMAADVLAAATTNLEMQVTAPAVWPCAPCTIVSGALHVLCHMQGEQATRCFVCWQYGEACDSGTSPSCGWLQIILLQSRTTWCTTVDPRLALALQLNVPPETPSPGCRWLHMLLLQSWG
jgi:hypothetical protein